VLLSKVAEIDLATRKHLKIRGYKANGIGSKTIGRSDKLEVKKSN
jgi:hypothetical protein